MQRYCRRRLHFDDGPPDSHPHELPVAVTTIEHQVDKSRCLKLSVGTMLSDEQVRRPGAARPGSPGEEKLAEQCR